MSDLKTIDTLRLVDHPKGREAMTGWRVQIPEGNCGVIIGFSTDKDDTSEWGATVQITDKGDHLNTTVWYKIHELKVL